MRSYSRLLLSVMAGVLVGSAGAAAKAYSMRLPEADGIVMAMLAGGAGALLGAGIWWRLRSAPKARRNYESRPAGHRGGQRREHGRAQEEKQN